jgi:hypothetical protein
MEPNYVDEADSDAAEMFVRAVVAAAVALVIMLVLRKMFNKKSPSNNPFADDDRKPRKEYVIDQKKRDAVIKQNFSIEKVGLNKLSVYSLV